MVATKLTLKRTVCWATGSQLTLTISLLGNEVTTYVNKLRCGAEWSHLTLKTNKQTITTVSWLVGALSPVNHKGLYQG